MKRVLLFIVLKVVEIIAVVIAYTLLCGLYSLFNDDLTPFWQGGGVLLICGFVLAACLFFTIAAAYEIFIANWKWAGKLTGKDKP